RSQVIALASAAERVNTSTVGLGFVAAADLRIDAGVVRFWLEAHRHSGDPSDLERARRGADELLAGLPEAAPEDSGQVFNYGLHAGWAGVMWLLEQVHRHTGEARFRDGALRLLDQIHDLAQDDGDGGVHWDETNELFYGNAGLGLVLLWAAEDLDHAPSLELATRAGRWLLGTAEARPGGLTWAWSPNEPDLVMPNFSHGTAGVSYFLARLYEVTGDGAFLDAALAGAGHLTTIAETGGGRYCLVFHHEDRGDRTGEDRYYLGLCHGPVGTTRLFEQLYRTTGDAEWRRWVDHGARAIVDSGIPEAETPGFWNNVSQCCGSAGVIEFFLDRYRQSGDADDLAFARRVADNLVERASSERDGLKWVQAEHRRRPEQLEAQVGFMQGASGIATALLHLDAVVRGLEVEPLRFVDDPWGEPGP
ncbi:MAG: lanthionine synthetase LanC family protein, partial [Acidobacteriota bacterium]